MRLAPKTFGTNAILPWAILTLMVAYVSGLSYFAENRTQPEPEFDFYGTSTVILHLRDSLSKPALPHVVFGTYNNIIEGERQNAKAVQRTDHQYEVTFWVNSPRSAVLYIDDEAIEVFLVPDSSLQVSAVFSVEKNEVDSLQFTGYTAGICQYYREKGERFGRQHVRAYRTTAYSDSLARYAHILDSLATQELAYLLIRSTPNQLPDWFIDFEKNEILYQKAYLKMANAYNRPVYAGYLDEVPLNDQEAVFSYYYYLYLSTYIAQQALALPIPPTNPQNGLLGIADTLLQDEVRDVFLTRTLFDLIRKGRMEEARKEFQSYAGGFSKRKYERFLRKQLADGLPEEHT